MPCMKKPEDALLVIEKNGHTKVEECTGPDELGHCPLVSWGDVVPCAGKTLAPKAAGGAPPWRLAVAPDADSCPIPSLPPARRSVWTLGALVALMGAAVGATAATLVVLAVTNHSSTSTTTTKATATAPAKPPAAASGGLLTAPNVQATLSDYKVVLPTTNISKGIKSLEVKNAGAVQHELLVFHPAASIDPANLPLGPDGNVNEDAPGINKISDGENIDPTKDQARQVDLSEPGTYAFLCNLPGHYKAGMWTVVTVP